MYSLWQPKKVSLIKQSKGVHRLVPSIMSLDLWNDYSIEVSSIFIDSYIASKMI